MQPATASPNSIPRRRVVRRRRGRQFNWFVYPAKLAAVAIAGALCAWMLFAFTVKAAHPYLLGYTEERTLATMRQQVADQNRHNQALEKRVVYLQTPEGIETEARRNGYHKPGEHVFLLPTDASTEPAGSN